MTAQRIPAEVHPLASFLYEEMKERGWTTDDVAARMGGMSEVHVGRDLLSVMLILAVQKDSLLIGDDLFEKLASAFETSEFFLRDLDEEWRKWPDRRVPFECPDDAYGPVARHSFPTKQ